MNNILIAGGRGFIGSNLAKMLDSHDIAYDIADLKDGVDICSVDASNYDVVVLLAANLNHDMEMFQHNLPIYKWAARQTAHVIYTSSAAVYADSKLPHIEQEPTPAPTIYGQSKLLGERIISKALDKYTILRLANVYGDGDGNGAIDIFKRGGSKIYGDGKDVRDYVDVRTVCRAIMTIALNPSQYNKEVYNISSGEPMSTNQAFFKYGNGDAQYVPARGFDVKYSVLSNAKAKDAGLCWSVLQ